MTLATAAAHQHLFGQELTVAMKNFLQNLSLSLTGYVIANSLIFVSIVVAGRLLGPSQFGQYALTIALSQILIIPMLPGIDVAAMREVALHPQQLPQIAASGLFLLAACTLATWIGVLLVGDTAARLLGLGGSVVRIAALIALAMAGKTFWDSIVRGSGAFRLQLWVRIVDAALILFIFLAGYAWLGVHDWRLLALGVTGGALASAWIFYSWVGRGQLRWAGVTSAVTRRLVRYGWAGVIGAVAGILLASADKVLLGNFLGSRGLGVYQAYYFASVQLTGQLALIFLNVFFPAAVGQSDLAIVIRKLDRLVVRLAVPAIIGVSLFILATLWLFSSAYERNLILVLLMSVYAVLWFIMMTYWTLINTTGPRGILYASLNALVAGVMYLLLVQQLLPLLELYAPPIAFLAAFGYMGGAIWLWRVRFRFTLR
ncbi:MAG TPA: oligosaccharide flippase family protein [Candidatus Andersenbacteria bacterium]|nr:oligosaccharide flippase family protein [Candidatus Andersenbacteria bacterium]